MGWQDKVAGMCSPCSGIPAPCVASGRLGRHLPLVGGGPASAARRMGRAWARMGHRTSSALIALIASQRAFTVELTEQIRQEKDSS